MSIADRPWLRGLAIVAAIALGGCGSATQAPGTGPQSVVAAAKPSSFRVVTVTEGLQFPWSVALLPDGRRLVTERPGRLRTIDAGGRLDPQPIRGLPAVDATEQGGLLDVVAHPRFAENRLIYLSYTSADDSGRGNEVMRARLGEGALEDARVIFRLEPRSRPPTHYGSRLVFDAEGHLYVTLGDRSDPKRAQRLDDPAGKILRLRDDGSVPADNPFADRPGARGEIYSVGHRNVQGAVLHPDRKRIWVHEHGEDANDKLFVLEGGANYGWPAADPRAGRAGRRALMSWTPTIAPSGLAIYQGDRFPQWRGDVFLGSLRERMLVRLKLEGDRIVAEERMLKGELGRIRDVRSGPDGYLYLLVDDRNGRLVRLEPAPSD